MRLLALLIALSIALTACMSDDADPNPDTPESTPTTVEQPADPTEPEPTSTVETEPTATEEAEPSPTSEPEPTDTPASTPTAGADTVEAELATEIDRIAGETAQVRGLELLEEINSQIINRDQLRENLLELIEDEYGQEGADLDRDLLWILRLIPDRSLDYYQLQIDLFTEQVAGYYDSDTGELFVIGEDPELTTDQKVTMSHEITHAIQDQHFGLDRYDEDDTEFDKITAYQALYEGDATWTMVRWAVEHLSLEELGEFLTESATGADSETYDNAPRYIRDSLVFPYDAGFTFVEQLYSSGGAGAVDAAMEDPPLSTEQILHPEKYLGDSRDEPLDVEIPDLSSALGDGWEETYDGTLGEFDLRILLEENGATQVNQAAAGWGGTRFVMYGSGDDLLIVMSTRWDTPEDTAEFEEALTQTLSNYDQDGNLWFDGERYHATFVSGDRVVLTTSTNRDALASALDVQQVNTP